MSLKNTLTAYEKGTIAESIAAEYLSSNMYEVIATRVKTKYGEIDLICRNTNTIVAVEVKYRKDRNTIYECISERQKKRIALALLDIIKYHPASEYRVDFIYLFNGFIEHVENAFYIDDYIAY